MDKSSSNFRFVIIILVLVALILAEVIFLGYKFWFKKAEFPKETSSIVPSLSPLRPSPSAQVKPFVQLVFGRLGGLTDNEVILITEENQKVTYPFEGTEIFSFKPGDKEETISLSSFFDEDLGERVGVERVKIGDVKPQAPTYLILELTAEDIYLGRRLVIIKE